MAVTTPMRIIAGEFRSRKILPPASDATRPITDRVKQSLFDILTPRIVGAHVYDCFAGTGTMGLESLSRGAAKATFFEADRSAAALLRKNIATLDVARRSAVVDRDLFRWFETAPPLQAGDRAGIVFLDPPYRFLNERPEALLKLAAQLVAHLAPGGVVVFRHDAKDSIELAPFREVDRREYGGMMLKLLTATEAT
jgi:16S rRNA (guanine(966)-N(2))-methyltransferase RsmD